jgi:subtilisin
MLNQDTGTGAPAAQAYVRPSPFPGVLPPDGGTVADDAAAAKVESHVRQLAAVSRITPANIYAHVGAFSANLTAAQELALEQDPSVAEIIPDEQVRLDDLVPSADDATLAAGSGVRTMTHPTQRVPPGVRRVGAGLRTLQVASNGGHTVNADVAIIDTGIERDHPDLNVVGGYNCTGRNPNKWDDNDGHGTHVAGIVGGTGRGGGVVGVAPGARLWSVKVLDSDGFGWISWLVCGVDWVTAQRDPQHHNRPLFEVANMSISYVRPSGNNRSCDDPRADMLHKAICRSIDAGVVYVVAAGNEGHNARRNRPAAYDQVITVAALADYDGRGGGRGRVSDSCPYWTGMPDDTLARFSNYGLDVDFVAPGVCVLSTWLHGRYAYLSGTSMAAPHVTGAVAVYRAMNPRATPQQVRMALEAAGRMDWRTASYPNAGPPPKAVWVGSFRSLPDFVLRATVHGAARAGGTLALNVSVTRSGGFSGPVEVTLVDGVQHLWADSASVARTGTLLLHVGRRVRAGTYDLTLQAAGGGITHTTTVAVSIRS